LTEKQIRRGSHRSTRALEDAIRVYLADHNAAPKPFVWVKSEDEIIDSIARFALRTSGTGHWFPVQNRVWAGFSVVEPLRVGDDGRSRLLRRLRAISAARAWALAW